MLEQERERKGKKGSKRMRENEQDRTRKNGEERARERNMLE
jgi:hypothetical protein